MVEKISNHSKIKNKTGRVFPAIFHNQKQYQMKKSTAQIIAIIILCLVICTADSWFNF